MNIRNVSLFGSLFFSGLLMLGACSSSSSGSGGAGGSAGGTTGSAGGVGGTTSSVGGTTARGGTAGSAGGTTGSLGGTAGSVGGTAGSGTATGGRAGAAGGSSGGTSGSAGAAGGGSSGTAAGGATGSCGNAVPACVADVLSGCNPSGACTTSARTVSTTGFSSATCYANGVKRESTTTIDTSTGGYTSTTVVTKSGATCYSYDALANTGGASGSDAVTFTFKNVQGATIGTLDESKDAGGNTIYKVTCGGQTATVTDLGLCSPPRSSSSGAGGSSGDTSCPMSSDCTP